MKRLWVLGIAAGMVTGCNLRDAMQANVSVVAEAEGHELTVDRMAEVVAQGKGVLLQEDVISRIAGLWVDYMLFAQRIADGDSLLDSVTVVEAMWGQARQAVVDYHHEQLLEDQLALSPETVDSAYQVGDHRLIYHILFRTPPDMSPPAKAAQKQKAGRLREGVASGRVGWDLANDQNEDYTVRSSGGSLGLLTRGATVPPFERVAFALAPGEISPVTETSFGYHIIRRPALAEARDEFVEGLENLLIEHVDSIYLSEMETRWEVTVRKNAAALMREAADDLRAAKESKKVVGTYRGGRFTVADFSRWLQTLDVRIQGQVVRAEDDALLEFARALMRNHILVVEAQQAGHTLRPEDVAELKSGLAASLGMLREQMGLDSALAGAGSGETASRIAEAQVLDYLAAVVGNRKNLIPVPPFLADKLRAEGDWDVSRAGVGRAVERAVALQTQLDSLSVPPPAADSAADSVAASETER